jgi:hypothetical protein
MKTPRAMLSSVRRLGLLTRRALREAAHQRIPWLMAAGAVLLTLGGWRLRELNFGAAEARFLTDFATGTRMLCGSLLAIALPAALFFPALESRTIQLELMHGASRTEWLLSRLAATWTLLAGFTALVTIALALMLNQRGMAVSAFGWLSGDATLAFARLAVIAAAAFAFCAIARSPLLAQGLSVLLVLAGQLSPVWLSGQPVRQNLAQQLASWVGGLLPNLQLFEQAGDIATDPAALAGMFFYGAGYCLLYGGVACVVFSRREL